LAASDPGVDHPQIPVFLGQNRQDDAVRPENRVDRTHLEAEGYIARGGQIIDATIVSVPRQRNTKEEKDKTTAPNQLWQTDFTYLKVIGWGWFYLSTVLDDFSRYIIAWKLCTTMKAEDVTVTLEMALVASGLDKARVLHRPRLLSDNGSSYISEDLAKWMERHNMAHVRGAPYHPMTQGKIERWHQTLKNRILLENYFLPGDLEGQIEAFVDDYNHRRYHESIDNLTPADVYFGRGPTILLQRERIKRQTITARRLQHQRQAA
jgi:putative transposase